MAKKRNADRSAGTFGGADYRTGAIERLSAAYTLLQAGHFADTIYLAGRAVEGMLRAVIWHSDADVRRGPKSLDTGHDLRELLSHVRGLGLLNPTSGDEQLTAAVHAAPQRSYDADMYALRLATPDDFDAVLTRTKQLNAVEQIVIDDARLTAGLRRLFAEPQLGAAWLVLRDGAIVGHAVVTYGYDLEFGGHDSFLTEMWIDEAARNAGAATAALRLLEAELRARDIRALHLGVRPENPAVRLYERTGFVRAPRLWMTKTL